MKEKQKTMLVFRTSALGEVVMCIPVIYSLAEQYPDLNIVVVTDVAFANLFIECPENITLVVVNWRNYHKGIIGFVRLLRMLSEYSITHVADLHHVFRSKILDCYYRMKKLPVCVIDKVRKERVEPVRKDGKRIGAQKSNFQRYADVFAALGFPIKMSFNSLLANDEGFEVRRIFPIFELPTRFVGIAPFARNETQTYPLEQMEEVVKYLSERRYWVFLFGAGHRESEILENWASKYTNCVALPGLLKLEQEVALMRQLDVIVTMDSVNMQMASLVDTPVVSIWGSTTPECGFAGWKQTEANVICRHLPCQPCSVSGSKECPLQHFSCMNSIQPEAICEKVEQILNEIVMNKDKSSMSAFVG